MWPRRPALIASEPRADVLPRWVRSLDDYWSWFAEQLDYSGGRLADESVQVQVVEDEATGERLALILGRQRIVFHGGSWLEFRVVVDRSLEQVEYNYHYGSVEGELIWRMDKHPGHGELSHIHRPDDRHDPNPEVDITDVLSEIFKQLE
jgi:hypothetical protein